MRDEDMLNILKNFNTVDDESPFENQVPLNGDDAEEVRKFSDPNKDAMRSILEGFHNVQTLTEELGPDQKSVKQMPGTHTMAKATAAKHPAKGYLVGDIHGEKQVADKGMIDQAIQKVWDEKYSGPMSGAIGIATLVHEVMDELKYGTVDADHNPIDMDIDADLVKKRVDAFSRFINTKSGGMSQDDKDEWDEYHGETWGESINEAPVYADPRDLAKRMWVQYHNNPEVKAAVDNSPEPFRALIYTSGIINNPEKIDGSDYYHNIVDHLEDLDKVEEAKFGNRTQTKDVYKKQSLADVFKSMDEAEDEKKKRLEKEFYNGIQKQKELKKGDNGKFELSDAVNESALNGSISNFDSMADDMKLLMSKGKTIHLIAKEAHVSDRYKGDIYEYKLTAEQQEQLGEDARSDAIMDIQGHAKNLAYFAQDAKSIEEEFRVNNGDTFIALAKKIVKAVQEARKAGK